MDKDAKFEVTQTAPRYVDFDPAAHGMWTPVIADGGDAVAVVYTDERDSAGVIWLSQPDSVTRLFHHFASCRKAGIPAAQAYRIALTLDGVVFGQQETGPLEGVNTELAAIMEEMA